MTSTPKWAFAVALLLAATLGCVEKGDTNVSPSTGGAGGSAGPDSGGACAVEPTTGSSNHCFRSIQTLDWNSGVLRVVDLDGDGDLDIVGSVGPTVALNDGNGSFSPPTSFGSDSVSHPTLGDVDGDGDPDLVGVANDGTAIVVYTNELGQLQAPQPLVTLPLSTTGPSDAGPQQGPWPSADWRLVDVDTDGKIDMVVAGVEATGGSILAVLKGDGAGGFAAPSFVPAQGASLPCVFDLLSDDWNLDGKPDLKWCDKLFVNDGLGGFTTTEIPSLAGFSKSADMDGASGNDLVFLDGEVHIALNDGTGNFALPTKVPGGHVLLQLDVADFNGDGYPDVVASSMDAFYDRVWFAFGDGTGTVTGGVEYAVGDGQNFRSLAAGDFDGDGKGDLVVATSTDKTKVLLTR